MPVAVIERSERLAPKVTRGWKRKRTAWSKEEWRGGREGMGWVATVYGHVHARTHTHTHKHTSGELHGRAFPCVCPGDATGRQAGVKRRVRDTRAMGGARMAFCGQSSMCLYAVMCYRFLARSPAAFGAYARARRYSRFPVLSYAR